MSSWQGSDVANYYSSARPQSPRSRSRAGSSSSAASSSSAGKGRARSRMSPSDPRGGGVAFGSGEVQQIRPEHSYHDAGKTTGNVSKSAARTTTVSAIIPYRVDYNLSDESAASLTNGFVAIRPNGWATRKENMNKYSILLRKNLNPELVSVCYETHLKGNLFPYQKRPHPNSWIYHPDERSQSVITSLGSTPVVGPVTVYSNYPMPLDANTANASIHGIPIELSSVSETFDHKLLSATAAKSPNLAGVYFTIDCQKCDLPNVDTSGKRCRILLSEHVSNVRLSDLNTRSIHPQIMLNLFTQLIHALHTLHSDGFVHGAVNADNIFVNYVDYSKSLAYQKTLEGLLQILIDINSTLKAGTAAGPVVYTVGTQIQAAFVAAQSNGTAAADAPTKAYCDALVKAAGDFMLNVPDATTLTDITRLQTAQTSAAAAVTATAVAAAAAAATATKAATTTGLAAAAAAAAAAPAPAAVEYFNKELIINYVSKKTNDMVSVNYRRCGAKHSGTAKLTDLSDKFKGGLQLVLGGYNGTRTHKSAFCLTNDDVASAILTFAQKFGSNFVYHFSGTPGKWDKATGTSGTGKWTGAPLLQFIASKGYGRLVDDHLALVARNQPGRENNEEQIEHNIEKHPWLKLFTHAETALDMLCGPSFEVYT